MLVQGLGGHRRELVRDLTRNGGYWQVGPGAMVLKDGFMGGLGSWWVPPAGAGCVTGAGFRGGPCRGGR